MEGQVGRSSCLYTTFWETTIVLNPEYFNYNRRDTNQIQEKNDFINSLKNTYEGGAVPCQSTAKQTKAHIEKLWNSWPLHQSKMLETHLHTRTANDDLLFFPHLDKKIHKILQHSNSKAKEKSYIREK